MAALLMRDRLKETLTLKGLWVVQGQGANEGFFFLSAAPGGGWNHEESEALTFTDKEEAQKALQSSPALEEGETATVIAADKAFDLNFDLDSEDDELVVSAHVTPKDGSKVLTLAAFVKQCIKDRVSQEKGLDKDRAGLDKDLAKELKNLVAINEEHIADARRDHAEQVKVNVDELELLNEEIVRLQEILDNHENPRESKKAKPKKKAKTAAKRVTLKKAASRKRK